MTHQYIGARYVPYYYENSLDPTSTEWEPNVHYEALTVVTLPNNHSYISKKDVPDTVGTPAANADYWLDTGSDNAYIQALSDRVDALAADFADSFDPTATYSVGDMVIYEDVLYIFDNAHTGAWDAADVTQINLTDVVANILARLNDIKKKSILVIGNSYVGRGCADLLTACFDANYGVGGDGSGFLTYTSHTSTFEDQIDSAIANPSIPNDEITDIIFVSAMGDTRACYEDESTFNSRMSTALGSVATKIAANFTNCTRIAVTLAESRSVPYFSNNKLSNLFQVHRAFKNLCPAHGIDYIGWSGFTILYNSGAFEADNYHPSTGLGAPTIGAWIRNAYFGNAEYRTIEGVGSNIAFNYAASSKITLTCLLTPDMAELQIRRMDSTSGDSVTLAAGDTNIVSVETATVPLPAPDLSEYLYISLVGIIKGAGMGYGEQKDFLSLIATGDTHGMLTFTNQYAPEAATAAQRVSLQGLTTFRYTP